MFSKYAFGVIILLSVAFFFRHVNARDTTNFFPHHVGDMWEYYFTDFIDDDTIQVFVIEDSVDLAGNHYVTQAARSINPIAPPGFFFWDTTEYIIDTLNQVWGGSLLIYKLNAQEGEQWVLWGEPGNYQMARVTEVKEDTVFGILTISKSFEYFLAADSTDTTGLFPYGDILAEGFGIIYRWTSEIGAWLFLRGAVINNILYGDTTLVAINSSSSPPMPGQFYLFQNYPNPFNPRTTIRFQLMNSGRITLTVYDVAGRLVRRLIDDQWYAAGEHQMVWNGKTEKGGDAASGVYIYQLSAGQQRLSRKMLLIR